MLRKIFLVPTLFFVAFVSVFSQVKPRDISLQEALEEAKAADKIVLLWIVSSNCNQCNEVALQGFANPIFARAVNNNSIVVRIPEDSKDFPMLDSLYHISNSLGYLFINADGDFLHRYAATTSYYVTNLEQLDKALKRKENPDIELKQLQKEYDNGKLEFSALYTLVAKKEELQLDHDQLTEEMLKLAPVDSANSLSFLQFLAAQTPIIDSKADQYLRKDNRNFNDAWYLMPLQKRSLINNRIILRSRNKAIKEKNIGYARRVASFAAGTNADRLYARRGYDRNMIEYYKGIHDTAAFLTGSVTFYDQYLMTVSVDSVQRADSLRKMELFANAMASPEKVMQPPGSSPLMSTRVQFSPATQRYANELNDGAWTIYTYTRDPVYLNKALNWAKRAIEFYDNPGVMDTYARLLYKTGRKEEALEWQEKAVKLSRERKIPSREFEEVFTKMKAGNAIDNY